MEAIRKLISEMNHTVKKTDVQEQFNKSILSLNNEILPMIEELETLIKDNNIDMNDLKELSNFNRISGIKAKDIRTLVNSIEYTLKDMNKSSSDFSGLLDKELPDLISRDSISIKEASILNVVNNYTNVILYTSDLVLYIISLVDTKLTGQTTSFVKFKLLEIREDLHRYATLLEFFRLNSKNLIKDLQKQSNDRLLVDSKDSGAVSMLSSFKSRIKLVGFIGNPIYHVKMWLIDNQVNRYEVLKERKKLTELKILDLKARQNGENDAKLQKAIEYHENRLESIEHQIRKIEQ